MAVLRQLNALGQMRLDVPHIRSLESAVAADIDLLAGSIIAGQQGLVVRGFEVVNPAAAVGTPATTVQLSTASGVLLHPLASEHGTIFVAPADQPAETLSTTSPSVEGSFTPGVVNYVGVDLRRTADDSTADLVMFLDANTLIETPKSVPLARLLTYKIIISATDFTANPYILAVAKITTDATNTVTAVEDARQLAYRLGSGGSTPNRYHVYPWSSGRLENTSGSIFTGGDKQLSSLKSWMDAVMSRVWEIGGGQYWYSPTADREVKLTFGQPVIGATGDNFQWNSGTSTLTWASLGISFANSPVAYNTIADGSAVLADNQCLYVDIDRTTVANLTAHVADLTSLGTPTVPGSRQVLAWRRGAYVFIRDRDFEVSRVQTVATTVNLGVIKLKYAAADPANPTVLAEDANGAYSNTSSGGNSAAFIGTGNGFGAGFHGTGGGSSGPGLLGTGGGTDGIGVEGRGTGSGYGVKGVGDVSGPGVIGISGTAALAGVFGSSNSASAVGVFGTGFTSIASSAVGTVGGNFVGGDGSIFNLATPRAGGRGVYAQGGAGSATNSGGAGGLGCDALGGAGGNAADVAGTGGTGGKGHSAVGGNGGNTTSPVTPGTGGIGLTATGGDGGTQAGGIAVGNGGSGIVATGGSGDVGGAAGIFTGGSSAVTPGVAVKAIAGAASTATNRYSSVEVNQGDLVFTSVTNPNKDVAFTNKLAAKNIPKAWGILRCTGAGPSVVEGFNVAGVSANTTVITVTLAGAMADVNFIVCPHILISNASTANISVGAHSLVHGPPSTFGLSIFDATNSRTNPTTTTYDIHFVVFGQQ